jgi:hypothetical protein
MGLVNEVSPFKACETDVDESVFKELDKLFTAVSDDVGNAADQQQRDPNFAFDDAHINNSTDEFRWWMVEEDEFEKYYVGLTADDEENEREDPNAVKLDPKTGLFG